METDLRDLAEAILRDFETTYEVRERTSERFNGPDEINDLAEELEAFSPWLLERAESNMFARGMLFGLTMAGVTDDEMKGFVLEKAH